MAFDIDEIFKMLSWSNEETIQKRGIDEAKKIKHLSVFILPIESKSVWENCAKVLISKSDEELKPYLIDLFKWLRDMNWPGAYLIYDRLKRMSTHDIEFAYSVCLSLADKTNDQPWKQALNNFKEGPW